MTTTPVAEVKGLTVSYQAGAGRVTVAEDIAFTLQAGRTLGLVGESGSGKSTVARTLLGHLRDGSQIDAGQVTVLGEDVFALPGPALRQLRGGTVSVVAQNAGQALTPSLRVGAQIREALQVHGLPADSDRVAELLRLVRLPAPETIGQRYPHELSGGQQQRVAIAMAVATDPQVLVLDEPTTALDVITQAAVLSLVNDLRERLSMAVLIVSHDLGVVSVVADDVLVLQAGRAVEHGPTLEVLGSPREDYTRELLDAAPRIEGAPAPEVRDAHEELALQCQGLDVRYPRAPRLAVSDFTVQVRRGETVAVVGESGSGKSTVAKALAGLAPVEQGKAVLRTGDAGLHDLLAPARARPVAVRRSVQMIFQNADLALNPRRSIADAIARPLKVFGRVSGRAEARATVLRLLEEVGLGPEFADRVPAQLSGGQRQRVGIARALAAEPTLLIADEITTALDVSVQASVLDLLAELRDRRALSCLFISHDLAVVRNVADRIVVMKDGRMVETAATAAIFETPRHPYTRSLLEAVVEPGSTDLPGSDADAKVVELDPGATLIEAGEGHWVRDDEGAVVT
ncbi:dipeptide ABC transporter ATP-binding protein [Ornithinimicrobium faecis]|uniref:ABC transporter ATP-binding protein n=1 Tax=Ornithinimicrobium faecis TaxID=2934158 RepID=A0ABY4YY88_9MICO|nr:MULTISPECIES: ABC transporter ATP-binding protein [unclassified Ornithinimicrobium]USQ81706.1 ABC transporter ATP-binding protein [Ornithinimicrobium sp. HY1793]